MTSNKKVAELVKYIISTYNEITKRKISRQKLRNIIFLIDMDYFKDNKKTITDLTYLKDVFGVIAIDSNRKDAVRHIVRTNDDINEDSEIFLGIPRFYYSCKSPKYEFLGDDELECANNIISKVAKLTHREFCNIIQNDITRKATSMYSVIDPYLMFYR